MSTSYGAASNTSIVSGCVKPSDAVIDCYYYSLHVKKMNYYPLRYMLHEIYKIYSRFKISFVYAAAITDS